ncbi:MAG TPA: hypothetical protein VK633_09245 [Verrucomicrobiae bacterium]|nr:hypothetical protein [Verrucomicrobiae bacterium]
MANYMKTGCALLIAALSLFSACGTHQNYRTAEFGSDKIYHKGKQTPQLHQSDVLGLHTAKAVNDEDIRRILDESRSFHIQENSNILLVQSGAAHPDKEMVDQLSRHFTVLPFTGVPSELSTSRGGAVSKALRLAAAESKAETVLVYWGSVEIMRDDLPTGIVSWVPVVDFMVPDEYQKVRMHLKLALIDVRTGQWATFQTEPVEDKTLTTRYAREKEPSWPIKSIKQRVYESCVRKLLDGYVLARN